jgi:DNA-binding transcriptional regulator LsrR (DeoR family)
MADGDPRSFLPGHASATFATAMVLHQHYGVEAGRAVIALSTYTAASGSTTNEHAASDVAFGSVVGMVWGRTVSARVRHVNLRVVPQLRAGGGVVFSTPVR